MADPLSLEAVIQPFPVTFCIPTQLASIFSVQMNERTLQVTLSLGTGGLARDTQTQAQEVGILGYGSN